MYTHRGAYLNAIGEVVEHGLSYRSVYLWTLPMFHCNGWCFTWAITAMGARHICLPEMNAERAVKLIQERGVTHLCGWATTASRTQPRPHSVAAGSTQEIWR
jgi:fatty-acyl-CoA synthase